MRAAASGWRSTADPHNCSHSVDGRHGRRLHGMPGLHYRQGLRVNPGHPDMHRILCLLHDVQLEVDLFHQELRAACGQRVVRPLFNLEWPVEENFSSSTGHSGLRSTVAKVSISLSCFGRGVWMNSEWPPVSGHPIITPTSRRIYPAGTSPAARQTWKSFLHGRFLTAAP